MKKITYIGIVLMTLGPAGFVSGANPVERFAALDKYSGWISACPKTQLLAAENGVTVVPEVSSSTVNLDCSIVQPLPGVTGRVGFWLYVKTAEKGAPLDVTFRFRDAENRHYEFNTAYDVWSSLTIPSGTWNYVDSYPVEARQGDMLPGSVGHLAGAATTDKPLPAQPLGLEGIRVSARGKLIERLQIGGVIFSRLDRRTSTCYWQAGGHCLTSEESGFPHPFLQAADYASSPGRYRIYWQISETRSGRAVASGDQIFTRTDEPVPHLDPVNLPDLSPGSYRLRTRVWKLDGRTDSYHEAIDWLLVFRGKEQATAQSVFPSEYDRIAIDSGTPSGVHDPAPHVDLPVKVAMAGLSPGDGSASLEWKTSHYDRRPIGQGTIPVSVTSAVFFDTSIPFDVPTDDNVFHMVVTLKQGKKAIDSREKTFGFRGTAPAVPHFEDVAAGVRPSVFIGVEAMGQKFRDDARYLRHLQAFRAMGFKGIEYAVEWADVEPLPGCFTFAEMDRQLADAGKPGFKIMLRFRTEFPRYTIPGWVTGEFTSEQDGRVEGLLSSGPTFSPCDPGWLQDCNAFLQAVASRYAGDKAVIAFKVPQNIREAYWLDRPFKYQFSDYSDAAAASFRDYLKARHGSLDGLDASPPQPWAVTTPLNLSQPWRDWCDFKIDTYNHRFIEVASLLHSAAPDKHLYFYSINALTGPPSRDTMLRLDVLNASLATGGSLPVGGIGDTRLYTPGYGLQLITEPNAYALPTAANADDHAGMVLEGSAGKGPVFFSNWPTMVEPDGAGDTVQGALVRLAQWNHVYEVLPRLRMPQAPVGFVFSWGGMSLLQRGMYSGFAGVLTESYLPILKQHGIEAFGADDTFTPEMLARFKVLVVPPETSPTISKALLAALCAYVQKGGFLVMVPDSGNIVPDDSAKSHALLSAIGVPEDHSPGAGSLYPLGKGDVRICRDAQDLRDFLKSAEFMETLSQHGVKPSFHPNDAKVVATPHDGQDGHLYLYVYNGSASGDVTLSIAESPFGGSAFKINDMLGGGDARTITVSGKETTFSIPLKQKTGTLLKISPAS